MPRILVVGSPERLRPFSRYLESLGDGVQFVSDDRSCEDAVLLFSPDVIVYEPGAPLRDGGTLFRRIRCISNVPILLIGGNEKSLAELLNAGADEVLPGTVDLDDLVAAVNSILRRFSRVATDMPVDAGDFHLSAETHRCIVRGREVHLTTQEFALLLYMARNPYRVLTHEELCRAAWGSSQSPAFLRPLILLLRKALEPDWKNPIYILTEFKHGYRFNPVAETRVAEEELVTAS